MRLRSSWLWAVVLVGHLVAAVAWGWMMPGGFSIGHPRFWVNEVWPVVAGGVSAATLVMAARRRWEVVRAVLIGLSGVWAGVGLVGGTVFMHSRAVVLVAPFFVATVACLASVGLGRKRGRGWIAVAGVAGAILGGLLVFAQRGGPPDTRPANPADGLLARGVLPVQNGPAMERLGGAVRVDGPSRVVTVQGGRMMLSVRPMLTFHSRSIDRGWSNWSRPGDRVGPECQMVAAGTSASGGVAEFLAIYVGAGRSALRVTSNSTTAAGILAESELSGPVYSHLNSFCQIVVAGHRQLSLEFSPCLGRRIEVMAFDYPIGRPARFAYLGRDGVFRVVEARSGEKGPYTELASGPLSVERPLTLTMYDGDEAVAGATLADWAAQAGMELSPTAGWGLPVNAIEFSLNGDRPSSPAVIYVTLAGTSVGRGWDTVAHAPGVYRNRLRVEVKSQGPTR